MKHSLKIILVIVFFIQLFYCKNIFCQGYNISKYKNALEWIKSCDSIKNVYSYIKIKKNDDTSWKFYVSDEILTFDQSPFSNEIYNYEFSDCNENIKSFLNLERYEEVAYRLTELQAFNKIFEWDLIIYFSYFVGNRMIASIKPNIRDPIGFEYQFSRFSGTRFLCLFYFDKNDNVKKVFLKPLSD